MAKQQADVVTDTKGPREVPPFSMHGVPSIGVNPREGSRLLRFWVKAPNTNSEIGTTLSRALRWPGSEIATAAERPSIRFVSASVLAAGRSPPHVRA
jgi:hypothetical protein